MPTLELLQERYGSSAPTFPLGEDNPVLQALLSHRSVRNYRTDALPAGTLERLIAAAQSAATSSNLQTWSVVAIEDTERKAQAATICGNQGFIHQAPLFLIFCADLSRLARISEAVGLAGEGLQYLEMFLMATVDSALAAQNAATAAESMGLGICYVGAARNQPRELAEFLKLPRGVFAVFGLTVGYPQETDTSAIKPRLPQAVVLHRETYDESAQVEAVAAYNNTMRDFYTAQGMAIPDDWAHHSARRVATTESLRGRHLLRAVLEDLGIPAR